MVQGASAQMIDLVFDLDGTLIDTKDGKTQIVDHAPELLAELGADPEVRLHVFSGGTRDHIREWLGKIVLPDGRSAFKVLRRIYTGRDLKNGKKDVSHIISGSRLEWTLLIDDKKENAAPGQERNLLHVEQRADRLLLVRERLIEARAISKDKKVSLVQALCCAASLK